MSLHIQFPNDPKNQGPISPIEKLIQKIGQVAFNKKATQEIANEIKNIKPEELNEIITESKRVNKDFWGETPLTLIFKNNKNGHSTFSPLMFLIEAGANVNINNNKKQNPLHLAAKCHQAEDSISLLIPNNTEVNTQDELGNTPLHYAAMEGCEENIEILLKTDIETNIQNLKGESPLMLAVKGLREAPNRVNIINLLLDKGANPTLRDNTNCSALQLAIKGHWLESTKILLKANLPAKKQLKNEQ
jgi:ankyrin repeat protein